MPIDKHGSALVTADIEIGVSGGAKDIYGMHIISGATAAVINLRNGTAVTSTIYIQRSGNANTGVDFSWPGGYFFPAGCFVDVDANTTSVLVSFDERAI